MRPFHWIRPQAAWVPGNRIELLENGEEFYPAVFDAIAQAEREVIIETFILFEDKVGIALQKVLINAAKRGVRIDLTVDGYGSPDLSDDFVGALVDAGVHLHAVDPQPKLMGLRTNWFRRMHRKIVVVDRRLAFVGGINYSADHLGDYGPEAKQDYAVRVRGPVVERIWRFAADQLPADRRPQGDAKVEPAGESDAMFVSRDNHRNRDSIERQYRAALRAARREVVIANAYFFPGYRLMRAMRRAAQRGVRVVLILQGEPDMAWVAFAAKRLYPRLVAAGVEIHEYCKRPLHGKVALVDDNWATVGSSNLDPLSLSLNLEANVMVRDPAFNRVLRERLMQLVTNHCSEIKVQDIQKRPFWLVPLDTIAYHATRHFPALAGLLPAHRPALAPLKPSGEPRAVDTTPAATSDAGQEGMREVDLQPNRPPQGAEASRPAATGARPSEEPRELEALDAREAMR